MDDERLKAMILQKSPGRFAEGAYGTVFFIPDSTRAIKVYKHHREGDEEHSRKTYDSETAAFGKAATSNKLKSLVPGYYGPKKVGKILDAQGNDISHQYYLDLNFEMDFVKGEFVKVGVQKQYEEIAKLFAEEGINYLIDASAVLDSQGNVQKIIDFGTEENELWHKD